MNNLYFYLTGVLTGLFAIISLYKNMRIKSLVKENKSLKMTNNELTAFKNRRLSFKRSAILVQSGWYNVNDPSQKWVVTFELAEIGHSSSDLMAVG